MIPPALVAFLLRWGVVLAVGASLLGYGYYRGHAAAMADWRATEARAERVALDAAANMERRGAIESVRYVQKVKVIHDQIETIKSVTTTADDARCVLPAEFARVWNAHNAASSAPAEPGADAATDQAVVARAQTGGR